MSAAANGARNRGASTPAGMQAESLEEDNDDDEEEKVEEEAEEEEEFDEYDALIEAQEVERAAERARALALDDDDEEEDDEEAKAAAAWSAAEGPLFVRGEWGEDARSLQGFAVTREEAKRALPGAGGEGRG